MLSNLSSVAASRRLLFVVFALSGFAGLIYESIWSHYLKLMLGHAAHAQTLVLVLFMGGMALGAWMCGRVSARLRNPLLIYAGVELILGVFALGFDPVFRGVHDWMLNTAAPAIAQPFVIEAFKWSIAALLILPACVLLGATFPLISSGVLRLDPASAGNALGWLYFTNSLGAVVGVLTSGFVLIALVGLPGTLLTAGLCNFLLALAVYAVAKQIDTPSLSIQAASLKRTYGGAVNAEVPQVGLLLLTAFLTGAASFMYEIGWIRMLSLVLGSATHSFELMLGAFILGLALGALYIRNRVDRVESPLRTLAWVQVLMGVAALGTLVVYGQSFDWMASIVRTLAKTETGYTWFNLLSQAICMALMLPVTFLAGMTLPIITAVVLRTSAGESAIGKVYSANTWGAIFGVVVAVNVAMPYLGLRNVVVLGAGIDIVLGLWLFSRAGLPTPMLAKGALVSTLILGLLIAATVRFDANRLASGVFRKGELETNAVSVWRRDGKTASIDMVASKDGRYLSIKTNGKTDAAIDLQGVIGDDYTMILLGALPLTFLPEAREVAVIGLGSGRSTHVFLGAPDVLRVDTIEIEPAMIEGARLFGPPVARTFEDPRSVIHIEDAKTFFARHQKQYDLIMSEPSNPWVSGVSSLFSQEFYAQIKTYIKGDGLFVQWLQLYEFDDQLFASVLKALGAEFEDYAVYAANGGDLVIVAKASGKLPAPNFDALNPPSIKSLTAAIGINRPEDLLVRRMGGRATVEPLVNSIPSPANSDYFPFLDQHAAKYRFIGGTASALTDAHDVVHRIEGISYDYAEVSAVPVLMPSVRAGAAFQLWAYMDWNNVEKQRGEPPSVSGDIFDLSARLNLIRTKCVSDELEKLWLPAAYSVGELWWPYMEAGRALQLVSMLREHGCTGETANKVDRVLNWLEAIAKRDWAAVSAQAEGLLALEPKAASLPVFLAREMLLADYMSGGAEAVRARVAALARPLPEDASIKYLTAVSGF